MIPQAGPPITRDPESAAQEALRRSLENQPGFVSPALRSSSARRPQCLPTRWWWGGLNDSLFSRTGKRLLCGDIGRHFSEGYCMKKTSGCAVSHPEPPPTINESATVRPRGLVNTGGAHRDQPRTIVLGRARSIRLSRTSHSIGNIRFAFATKGAIFQSPRERTRPEVEVHAMQTD